MNQKLNLKKKKLTYLPKQIACGLYVFQIIDEFMVDDPFYVASGMTPLKKVRVVFPYARVCDSIFEKNLMAYIFSWTTPYLFPGIHYYASYM